jgi:hypothetical protein
LTNDGTSVAALDNSPLRQFATAAQQHVQRRPVPKDPDGDRRKAVNPIV